MNIKEANAKLAALGAIDEDDANAKLAALGAIDEEDDIPSTLASMGKTIVAEAGNPFGITENVLAPATQAITQELFDKSSDVDQQLLDQGFTGDLEKSKTLLERYRQAKPEIKQQYEELRQANPVTAFASSVLSGGAFPLSKASQATGFLNKIAAGSKAGAGLGAVTGAIGSDADLTNLELDELAKDAAIGAGLGGALGGGVAAAAQMPTGIKKAGDFLADTIPGLRDAVDAKKIRAAGLPVVGDTAKKQIQEEISNKSEDVVDTLFSDKALYGKAKQKVLEKAESLGKETETKDRIESMLKMVQSIPGKNKNIQSDKKALVDLLEEYKQIGKSSPKDLDQAYKDVYDLAQKAESGLSTKVTGKIASTFKDLTEDTLDELAPAYDRANKGFSATKDALSLLNPKLESMDRVDRIEAQNALTTFFENMSNSGKSGDSASKAFGSFMDKFKQSNPRVAETLEPELQELARRFDLNKEAAKAGIGGVSGLTVKSGLIRLGAGVGAAQNVGNKIVSAGKRYITDSTPQAIRDLSNKLSIKSPKYSGLLTQLADKPERTRNAMVFSLMQRPDFRELISGDDDEQSNEN